MSICKIITRATTYIHDCTDMLIKGPHDTWWFTPPVGNPEGFRFPKTIQRDTLQRVSVLLALEQVECAASLMSGCLSEKIKTSAFLTKCRLVIGLRPDPFGVADYGLRPMPSDGIRNRVAFCSFTLVSNESERDRSIKI
jgi:hypothetical protein